VNPLGSHGSYNEQRFLAMYINVIESSTSTVTVDSMQINVNWYFSGNLSLSTNVP